MDLASFRNAVDNCPEGIAKCHDDLIELYRYVGLPEGSAYQRNKVWEELHKKIKNSFVSGHQAVWRKCKQLRDELIQNEVLEPCSTLVVFKIAYS